LSNHASAALLILSSLKFQASSALTFINLFSGAVTDTGY